MPIKYNYEGKNKDGKKLFSKKYIPSRWIPDYENNCVRNYDAYIKEQSRNKSRNNKSNQDITDSNFLSEEELVYFEGTYENACKFFNISGEHCKVYDKESKSYKIKENDESHNIKINRLIEFISKNQFNKMYVKKTSAELYELIINKMREQYYYIEKEYREDIAMEALKQCKDIVINVDNAFFSKEKEDQMLKDECLDNYIKENSNLFNKRLKKLKYFYMKHSNIWE